MQALVRPESRDSDVSNKENWQAGADGWSVDLSQGAALHQTGFRLDFSGHPGSRNFEVQPSGLSGGVGAIAWATMLRQGTDEYRRIFALADFTGGADDGDDDTDDFDGEKDLAPRVARKPVITVKRKRQIS